MTLSIFFGSGCASTEESPKIPPKTKGSPGADYYYQSSIKDEIVEAACGQCLFGLDGQKGCDLAVRLGGKAYFVDGVKMNELGDAHAADGMCNVVRKAKAAGELKGGRFVARHMELLP